MICQQVQQSLKNSFGTKRGQTKALDSQSVNSDQVTSTVKETQSQTASELQEEDQDSQQQDQDSRQDQSSQSEKDLELDRGSEDKAPVVDSCDKSNQLSSKEKLAKFSFEQKS